MVSPWAEYLGSGCRGGFLAIHHLAAPDAIREKVAHRDKFDFVDTGCPILMLVLLEIFQTFFWYFSYEFKL